MTEPELSIALIVPCFNEAESVPEFVERVSAACAPAHARFVLLAVDDGSTDGTFEAWTGRAGEQQGPEIRVIRLSRNFGKEIAISCGLQHCDADAAIIMDVDLQDPPELIPQMIEAWQDGFDSVIAIRSKRDSDSAIKRATASIFYRLMGRIADVEIPAQAGDFRLLSKRLVMALNAYPERTRFMKGLFATLGFEQKLLFYDRSSRSRGTSRFSLWKLWNFALDGITSFSSVPLRIWSYFGLILALTSFVYAMFIVVRTLIYGVDLPGYPSILVFILFFSGIQLISIGILGEYIGRLFTEVKQRPMYLVDESFGFSDEDKPGPLPPSG
jgi:glycosyltransferase involved in cell wall biosynthesis